MENRKIEDGFIAGIGIGIFIGMLILILIGLI